MQRCEWESYIKVQHAMQLLEGVNILTHVEKYSYGASQREHTKSVVR